ncbi:unnamed protein product [Tuber aestivum]|uniref:Uncharacterized protein n=1 Tax=Tuber aestivum TaxID=59557 RepID=A0A292Q517_9PEZI|nr:unnamed protein product [Tuber aestivum]
MSIWASKPTPPTPPIHTTGKTYHSTLLLLLAHSLEPFPTPAPDPSQIIEVPSLLPPPPHRRTFPAASAPSRGRSTREAVRKNSSWWEEYGSEALRVREEVDDLQHDLRLAARLQNRVLEIEEGERRATWGGRAPLGTTEEIKVLKKEWEGAAAGVVALSRRKQTATTPSTPRTPLPAAPSSGASTGLPTPRSSGTPRISEGWFRDSRRSLGFDTQPSVKPREESGNRKRRSAEDGDVFTPPPSPPPLGSGGEAWKSDSAAELPKFEYIPIKVPPLVKYAI